MSHSQGMTFIRVLKVVMDKVFIKQYKSNFPAEEMEIYKQNLTGPPSLLLSLKGLCETHKIGIKISKTDCIWVYILLSCVLTLF